MNKNKEMLLWGVLKSPEKLAGNNEWQRAHNVYYV